METEINFADAARLAILVEELVTNLYDHGGLGAEDEFNLELASTPTEITLVLTDHGAQFDPTSVLPVTQTPARGGGAGLALVKTWASRTTYECISGQNRLSVTLPLKTSDG